MQARIGYGARHARLWGLGLAAGAALAYTLLGPGALARERTPAVAAGQLAGAVRAAQPAGALLVTRPPRESPSWRVVARVGGVPAAWVSVRNGVALMRFQQRLLRVDLHAGSSDGGVGGWPYGDHVEPSEVHRLVAAFNGGFKLTYRDVGFMAGNRVAVPLKPGLASVVTYAGGATNIGAWGQGVPARGRRVRSVIQNQHLLVDHGLAAVGVSDCVLACWGGTIGLVAVVPRSGLGITAGGQLVWAGGSALSPAGLARALIDAGAQRALELDINPDWVAGYVYVHRPGGPAPVAVLKSQHGIAGALLTPYRRDFLAIVAR